MVRRDVREQLSAQEAEDGWVPEPGAGASRMLLLRGRVVGTTTPAPALLGVTGGDWASCRLGHSRGGALLQPPRAVTARTVRRGGKSRAQFAASPSSSSLWRWFCCHHLQSNGKGQITGPCGPVTCSKHPCPMWDPLQSRAPQQHPQISTSLSLSLSWSPS